MAPYGYQSNLEVQVLSASPLELVLILYDGAIQALNRASQHLTARDIRQRAREISRAVLILQELSTSTNREAGGDLAKQLVELYDYMQRRLNEANVTQSPEALDEVAGLLKILREGWADVMAQAGKPPPLDSLTGLSAGVPEAFGNQPGESQTSSCG